jgi:multidrug transporter EmrE-like cation transporter
MELVFLFSSVLMGACGQILLKCGVNRLGQVILGWPEILNTLFQIFTNIWIVTGIMFFVSSMILWIKVISTMELSKAYPTVSLSYIIVFILSVFLFSETVTPDKIIGLILVSAGVYCLHM